MAEPTTDPRSCPYCGYERPDILLDNGATAYCPEMAERILREVFRGC